MSGDRKRARGHAIAKPAPVRAIAAIFMLGLAALMAHAALADEKIIKSHGYSFFGDLRYPADYPHFNYVNPDAPKGGEISLALPGTFDSMNPYSRKGRSSALATVMYESLLGEVLAGSGSLPADDYDEMYGLLAHTIEYPESKTGLSSTCVRRRGFPTAARLQRMMFCSATTCFWIRG